MKFLELLKRNQQQILLGLFVLLLFRSCNSTSELKKLRKEYQEQRVILNNLPTKKDIQIEGLKSEMRMIQATDRKMMDLERQNQIEKELQKLNKE